MITPRSLLKISIFLIIINIRLQALPDNSAVCGLDFGKYPYKPVGECVDNKEVGEVIIWGYVPTSRCCQNSLNSLSQSLALLSTRNQQIFLTEDQWQACTSEFHSQGSLSISSCGFDILYQGNGKCSGLTLDSFKLKFGEFYDPLLNNCSQFNVPDFNTRCSSCVEGISNLIEHVITDLQVQGDDFEKEICSIATVIAIASSGIVNDTWVRNFYLCLPAMDTGVSDHGYLKIKSSDIKAVLVAIVGIIGLVALIILIKYVTKTSSDKPIEGKVVSKWSGLYRFSKAEIEKAINYGNNKVSLGAGSAGTVYQGVLPSGQLVAIKHIYKTAMSGSFTREVEGLSRIRHPNLVSLFGCCVEDGEQYLVYEYCCNGNLAHNLLRGDTVLSWDTRVKILKYCALALRFLHTHPDGCIVHRDIKVWRKVIELNIDARDRLTKKAKDVVMGKRPLEDFIDPRLEGELNIKDFESILRIAVLSVASSSKGRPTIKDVFDEMDRVSQNTTNTTDKLIPCNGTIAECDADTAEFQMDSEIHHRLLQQGGKHIGYGALEPDRPACNTANGKAYANCVPQRNGNPPSRGCRPYEHCRS
ncbi:hypothetical protein J5N97_007279 [Dioscorea zingiberensis]|uniref:non-specific serine/threonine protein kinase n=1 Tax=Dioscorea zingiberensis TaxID=325984 RepID=A0A9D5HUC2_9LILI|nr:hypothetical protein J5N97_007279 [Dioscorea zingiberensis]